MAAETGPPPTLNQPVVGSSPTRLTPVERIRVALSGPVRTGHLFRLDDQNWRPNALATAEDRSCSWSSAWARGAPGGGLITRARSCSPEFPPQAARRSGSRACRRTVGEEYELEYRVERTARLVLEQWVPAAPGRAD